MQKRSQIVLALESGFKGNMGFLEFACSIAAFTNFEEDLSCISQMREAKSSKSKTPLFFVFLL